MRRALVVTNDTARHPFRQHFLYLDEVIAVPREKVRVHSGLRFFGVSYAVFFTFFMGMIL